VDIREHIKQQRLQYHEKAAKLPSHSRTPHAKLDSVSMDDNDSEASNHSDYEKDDFVVDDDEPIEYHEGDVEDDYEESQRAAEGESNTGNNEDDGEDEEDEETDENQEDGAAADSLLASSKTVGQHPIFNHTFSNRKAFTVYIQYLISACADTDFVNMMREKSRDDYFTPALRKVKDLVCSRKDSLVRSSVWDEGFKYDLEHRPRYRSWSSHWGMMNCEACHRPNRTATYQVGFSGPEYNMSQCWNDNLLEPPELDEDDQLGDSKYHLGRFCHSRTQLYHKLHHFPLHIYEQVKKKVESIPGNPEEVVNNLLDNELWMNEIVDEFKSLLQEADEFMEDESKGDEF